MTKLHPTIQVPKHYLDIMIQHFWLCDYNLLYRDSSRNNNNRVSLVYLRGCWSEWPSFTRLVVSSVVDPVLHLQLQEMVLLLLLVKATPIQQTCLKKAHIWCVTIYLYLSSGLFSNLQDCTLSNNDRDYNTWLNNQ